MLRFFIGIVLVQIVTGLLLWLNIDSLANPRDWAQLLIPACAIALVTTFWFGAVSRELADTKTSALREGFAREREKLVSNAERAKTRMLKKTQQEITRESSRAHAKANFKVGAALSGAVGFGVLMMFTQFASLGLLLLSTAGGTLGGYMLRSRQTSLLPVSGQARTAVSERKIETLGDLEQE
ncbi:MAG: hypothetical protein ACR2P1_28995 [Pseudomonadales bacterium]